MKIKKSRLIIISIIIINLIIMLCLAISKSIKSEKTENTTPREIQAIDAGKELKDEHLEKKELIPDGITFYSREYKGNINQYDLYKKLYKIVFEDIPELHDNTKELSKTEIEEYYNRNQSQIINELGIEEIDKFIILTDIINNELMDINSFDSCYIDTSEFEDDGEYFICIFRVQYKTGLLQSKIYISNNSERTPLIKIIPSESDNLE